jgi:hypothetical protein
MMVPLVSTHPMTKAEDNEVVEWAKFSGNLNKAFAPEMTPKW